MKKIVSFLLAGTLVISCFAFSASAGIVEGDGGTHESNDAYSGLIDGQGPVIEEDDDFADTIAQPVIEKIAALGEITLEKEADVEAARAAYDALTDLQKSFVTNYADLLDAEAKIVDLTAAKAVTVEIAALGTITLDKEDAVKAARASYDALTAAQKALVTNLKTLTDAEDTIVQLKKEAADKEAAQAVVDKIGALGEITLDKEADVKAARTAYDALTDAQKALVPKATTDALEAAEQKIVDLKAEAADKQAAQAVIDTINNLGDITSLDQAAAVEAARAAYNALTDAQKAYISQAAIDLLEAAEQAIEDLQVKRGDVDGDGNVTVSDVVELRKLIVAGTWSDREFAAGNLDDSDNTLTVSDVVELRKLIVAGV